MDLPVASAGFRSVVRGLRIRSCANACLFSPKTFEHHLSAMLAESRGDHAAAVALAREKSVGGSWA